jgi:hypothetical protein
MILTNGKNQMTSRPGLSTAASTSQQVISAFNELAALDWVGARQGMQHIDEDHSMGPVAFSSRKESLCASECRNVVFGSPIWH